VAKSNVQHESELTAAGLSGFSPDSLFNYNFEDEFEMCNTNNSEAKIEKIFKIVGCIRCKNNSSIFSPIFSKQDCGLWQ
jgi:hypothetical protein